MHGASENPDALFCGKQDVVMVSGHVYTCNTEVKMKIKPMVWLTKKDVTGSADKDQRGASYWHRGHRHKKNSQSKRSITGGKHGND